MKPGICEKMMEWIIVQTEGRDPFSFMGNKEDDEKGNPYLAKYCEFLEFEITGSPEACLSDPKLKYNRYVIVKSIEHIYWKRKNLKEFKLPDSVRKYRIQLKKNN